MVHESEVTTSVMWILSRLFFFFFSQKSFGQYFTFEINLQGLASNIESKRASWIGAECLFYVIAIHRTGVGCRSLLKITIC